MNAEVKKTEPSNTSTKSVGGVQSPKPDPDAPKKVVEAPEVKELTAEERAELEKATNLDPKEAKDIEEALGDYAEDDFAEPKEDEIDKAKHSLAMIRKLVDRVHPDTPDEHTIYGAAGVIITMGDLRNITKWVPKGA